MGGSRRRARRDASLFLNRRGPLRPDWLSPLRSHFAARAAAFAILARLAEGAITLTTVCLLAPFLMDDNHEQLLEIARHKRKREVELIVAAARPQPIVPSTIRKLPHRTARLGPDRARQTLSAYGQSLGERPTRRSSMHAR
jgi:hypothetical protein